MQEAHLPQAVTHLFSPPSKQKSIKLFSTIRSLLYSKLVYMLEKLKFEIEFYFLRLLHVLIALITGLSFCTNQTFLAPVKDLDLSLYVCICLKNQRKLIIVLAKGLIENLGDALMNLALMSFLCIKHPVYIR